VRLCGIMPLHNNACEDAMQGIVSTLPMCQRCCGAGAVVVTVRWPCLARRLPPPPPPVLNNMQTVVVVVYEWRGILPYQKGASEDAMQITLLPCPRTHFPPGAPTGWALLTQPRGLKYASLQHARVLHDQWWGQVGEMVMQDILTLPNNLRHHHQHTTSP
jgi:hypothetical protein